MHTPEKYGIYQSVGDTVEPGGIIRALRTIPMFETIAVAGLISDLGLAFKTFENSNHITLPFD